MIDVVEAVCEFGEWTAELWSALIVKVFGLEEPEEVTLSAEEQEAIGSASFLDETPSSDIRSESEIGNGFTWLKLEDRPKKTLKT